MGDVPPQHWTQDEAQLERLVSSSALGRREKWRRRSDYRERTIRKVLANLGETYDWPQEVGGSRPRSFSSSHSPLGVHGDDENNEEAKIVWFAELGEPKEREYLIEKIGVKGYPIVAFGAGGVAKSFAMLAGGGAIASASGVEEWLGLRVLDHGHVLYLDFEGGEQARRRAHPRSPGDGGRHRSGPRTAHRRRTGDGLQQPLAVDEDGSATGREGRLQRTLEALPLVFIIVDNPRGK